MGEGERLHSERRKKFWRILGGLAAIGFVTGAVGQFAISVSEHGQANWPSWAPLAGTIGVIIVAIAVAYGSWRFFVSVDEVEVADNLWACLIGFYVYAILFPAWWALHKLGQVPEVNDWAVFMAAMLSSLAVYGYRKIRFS
jgi:uncharacterized membrane protein